ncbi:putative toxin-antitoxin system toxin component, PIN family [Candidatus Woesearchaeota archaeon]|nr:putative toxin-antitoxin system toxin component, PIN family [Candidatus Woesearchaeota archaeon]
MSTGRARVVLDTNIVVSAAISKEGNPAKLFELLINGQIINFTTRGIIEEIREVFGRPAIRKVVSPEYREFILTGYLAKSIVVKPDFYENVLLNDKDDIKFIDCAIKSKADIISGDSHLLGLKSHKGIRILSPKEFLVKC